MFNSIFNIRFFTLLLLLAGSLLALNCNEALIEPEPPVLKSTSVPYAEASYVRIYLRAQVTAVDDPGSLLGGRVNVGDEVGGSYLYDSSCADSRKHKRIGQYVFDQPPFEIKIVITDLNFNSDPSSVDMMITVKDEVRKQGLHDTYEVSSSNNLEVLPGVGISDMVIFFKDADGGALSSDALPESEPDLLIWTVSHQLTLTGSDGWTIFADIASASTVLLEAATENRDKSKDKFKQQ